MAQLHDIPVKSYCGPAALMAVTGLDLPAVRSALNIAGGRRENAGICSVNCKQVLGALTALGYTFHAWRYWDSKTSAQEAIGEIVDMKRPTLEWLAENLNPEKIFIVAVTGHLVAMCNGMVYDNWARYGEHYSESRWRRCKVNYALSVEASNA